MAEAPVPRDPTRACPHSEWEPVEVAGEVVANVCVGCLQALPASYSGHTEAVMVASSEHPVAYVPLPGEPS